MAKPRMRLQHFEVLQGCTTLQAMLLKNIGLQHCSTCSAFQGEFRTDLKTGFRLDVVLFYGVAYALCFDFIAATNPKIWGKQNMCCKRCMCCITHVFNDLYSSTFFGKVLQVMQ